MERKKRKRKEKKTFFLLKSSTFISQTLNIFLDGLLFFFKDINFFLVGTSRFFSLRAALGCLHRLGEF